MSLAPANPRLPVYETAEDWRARGMCLLDPLGPKAREAAEALLDALQSHRLGRNPLEQLDFDALSAADIALRDAELMRRRFGRHAREDHARAVLVTIGVMLGAAALVGVAWAICRWWVR